MSLTVFGGGFTLPEGPGGVGWGSWGFQGGVGGPRVGVRGPRGVLGVLGWELGPRGVVLGVGGPGWGLLGSVSPPADVAVPGVGWGSLEGCWESGRGVGSPVGGVGGS